MPVVDILSSCSLCLRFPFEVTTCPSLSSIVDPCSTLTDQPSSDQSMSRKQTLYPSSSTVSHTRPHTSSAPPASAQTTFSVADHLASPLQPNDSIAAPHATILSPLPSTPLLSPLPSTPLVSPLPSTPLGKLLAQRCTGHERYAVDSFTVYFVDLIGIVLSDSTNEFKVHAVLVLHERI